MTNSNKTEFEGTLTLGGVQYTVIETRPDGFQRGRPASSAGAPSVLLRDKPLEHMDVWLQRARQNRNRKHSLLPEIIHADEDGVVLECVRGNLPQPPLPLPRAIEVLDAIRMEMHILTAALQVEVVDIPSADVLLAKDGSTRLKGFPSINIVDPEPVDRFPLSYHRELRDLEKSSVVVWGRLFYFLTTGHQAPHEFDWGTDYNDQDWLPQMGQPQLIRATLGQGDSLTRWFRLGEVSKLRALGKACKPFVRSAVPQYRTGFATTLGRNSERLHNEDAYGVVQGVLECHEARHVVIRACVADGCGGESHSEKASHAATHAFCHEAMPRNVNDPAEQVRWTRSLGWAAHEAVMHNKVVRSKGICVHVHREPPIPHDCCASISPDGICRITEPHDCCIQFEKPGATTLTGVVVVDTCLTLAHVGDTRAYLQSHNADLQLLTADHTANGGLERVLGDTRTELLAADYVDTLAQAPRDRDPPSFATWLTMQVGDVVVLVSDGVWGAWNPPPWYFARNEPTKPVYFPDLLARVIAESEGDPQAIADQLVTRVLDTSRADDNATVVAVQRTA